MKYKGNNKKVLKYQARGDIVFAYENNHCGIEMRIPPHIQGFRRWWKLKTYPVRCKWNLFWWCLIRHGRISL